MITRVAGALAEIKTYLRLSPFDVNEPNGRANERHRRIFLSSIASIFAKGLALAALIISTPLTLEYLGPERFGLWMTVSALITALGFADLGIGNGLLNVIAEAHGRDDRDLAKKAVATSFALLTVIGVVLASAFYIAYPFINWGYIFNISGQQAAAEVGASIMVLVICLSVSLPLLTVQRVQYGYQDGFQASLWLAVSSIFMLVGILWAIHVKAGLQWLILAAAGGPVLAIGLNWIHQFFFVRRWLLPKISYLNWNTAKSMVRLGAVWVWYQFMTFIGTAADNLIISNLFGAGSVGGYAVMNRLFFVILVAQVFMAPLWSAFAEAFERGDLEWVRKTFRRTLFLFLLFGVIGALVMGVGSFWVITVWVGAEMVPTPLLALGFALWSIVTNIFGAIAVLMANNKHLKQLTIFVTIAALSSFALKIIFAPFLGITWIIWATVLGYAVACVLGIRAVRRILRSTVGYNKFKGE
jgi:O-antigen/teichoic acid export membrane protein